MPYAMSSGIDILIPPASRFAKYLEEIYFLKEALDRINEIYPEERSVMKESPNGSTAIRGARKGNTQ
jgi:hypothetical protein